MIVVGLDLSLTSTGVCRIDDGKATVQTITSKGKATATLYDRYNRLERLAAAIDKALDFADLVVIEGPSFGQQRQGGQHDRAGLWWMVVQLAICNTPGVAEVPPACRMKYATGRGNAAKDSVLAAVIRRYPDVEVSGNDEADALVLAAMGARWMGSPIEASLPAVNLEAMQKVTWSDLAGAA